MNSKKTLMFVFYVIINFCHIGTEFSYLFNAILALYNNVMVIGVWKQCRRLLKVAFIQQDPCYVCKYA